MRAKPITSIFGSLLLGALVFPLTSHAAPQILGLVATSEPTPLNCADGECRAEFTAFCLQEHRYAPPNNHPYRTARNADLAVILTKSDGSEIKLPGSIIKLVNSTRGFSSVSMGISQAVLDETGAVSAAIEVGEYVSLIPEPEAGDKEPLGEAEIAHFTGAVRTQAAAALDPRSDDAVSMRTVTKIFNNLPVDATPLTHEVEDTWRAATGEALPGEDAQDGLKRVAKEFQFCAQMNDWAAGQPNLELSFRGCLAALHDELSDDLTRRIWKQQKTGS